MQVHVYKTVAGTSRACAGIRTKVLVLMRYSTPGTVPTRLWA
jgi:hypothetical protein